jgi:hypothetical protein
MAHGARALLSIALAVFAAGCSSTAGSTWVSEPEPGFFAHDDVALATSAHPIETFHEPNTPAWQSATTLDEGRTPRPRLTETVTLGETYAAYTDRSAEPRAADRSNVNVTVNNYVTPQNDTYDGYYGAYPVYRDARLNGGARPSQPIAPTRPGQSWPAPKSHGPAFPFRTAPADPWAPAR